MFTVNSAGMKNRSQCLISMISSLDIGIFTIQETHYEKKGKLKINSFLTFEAIRKIKYGGTRVNSPK